MAATPAFRPFLQPNALAQTTRDFGRELRGIRGAEAAAIAAAQGAALDRQSETQRTALSNAPAISDRLGGSFLASLAAGGLPPEGALSGQNAEFAARSANFGQQNIFAEGFEKIAGGARDFTNAGLNLSELGAQQALQAEIPGFRQGLTEVQGGIASAAAGATKVGTPIAVARDNITNEIIGFAKTTPDLVREMSRQERLSGSFTVTIEAPDKIAIGGEVGTSTFVPGQGGGGKPPPASETDTPAGDEAQPEGTGGDPSVLNATDPPQQRVAEDEARTAQGQPLTTNAAIETLTPVEGDPVAATGIPHIEEVLRGNGAVKFLDADGLEVTLRSAGDGEHAFVSGGGRSGKKPSKISALIDEFNRASAGQ